MPYQNHIWITPVPKIGLWTLSPRFLRGFSSTLSPRSLFLTRQRFLLLNHVTSGCMSLRSFFPPGQRFLLPKTHDFRFRVMTSFICSRPIRSQHYHPYERTLLLVDFGTALSTQSFSSSIVFGQRNLPSARAKTYVNHFKFTTLLEYKFGATRNYWIIKNKSSQIQ